MTVKEAIEILERYDDLVWQSEHHITMGDIADALQVIINTAENYENIIAEESNASYESGLERGRREMIEKATEWFANYLFEIGYPDDWVRDNGTWMNGAARFIKAMEE